MNGILCTRTFVFKSSSKSSPFLCWYFRQFCGKGEAMENSVEMTGRVKSCQTKRTHAWGFHPFPHFMLLKLQQNVLSFWQHFPTKRQKPKRSARKTIVMKPSIKRRERWRAEKKAPGKLWKPRKTNITAKRKCASAIIDSHTPKDGGLCLCSTQSADQMQLTSLLTSSHTICWQTQTNKFKLFHHFFSFPVAFVSLAFTWAKSLAKSLHLKWFPLHSYQIKCQQKKNIFSNQ